MRRGFVDLAFDVHRRAYALPVATWVVLATPGTPAQESESLRLFGAHVGTVGDLDLDGVSDVFVTDAWTVDAGDGSDHGLVGVVWVVSGRDGAVLRRLRGHPGMEFGDDVCGLGDVDRDGIPDLAVVSHAPSREWSHVQILSGATSEVLFERSADDLSVGLIGDFDGDDGADLLLGEGSSATAADRNAGGYDRVAVVSPQTGRELWSLHALEMDVAPGRRLVGLVAVGVGDVDGGGAPDVATHVVEKRLADRTSRVPSPYDPRPVDQVLVVQIWAGESKRVLIERRIGPDFFGGPRPLHTAGDVDGDGTADVILGFDGSFRQGSGGPMPDPALVVSGCTGATIFEAQDLGGWSICGLGDTDGDRCDDILLGCGEALFEGRIRLLAGPLGQQRYDVFGSRARGDVHFGYAVAAAGDLDGDGCADFIVGAANPWGGTRGSAYCFSGGTGVLLHVITPEAVIADWRARATTRPR